MDTFILYLILTLPSVGTLLGVIAVIGATGLLFTVCIAFIEGVVYRVKTPVCWLGVVTVLCGLISAAIPDKSSMLILAGNEAVKTAVGSEIGQDVVKLLHEKIKNELQSKEK